MVMDGKNYLVSECAGILQKILDYKPELQDIITFMDHLELMMEEEKRHLRLYVERLLKQN
jgi:hypothetical protein